MLNRITPLPGKGCRYWCAQRCLYEVQLNPGLKEDAYCLVLQDLEHRFDDHVLRCERFGLSAQRAGQIWKKFMHQCLGQTWDCPDYLVVLDDDQEYLCVHLVGEICLRRLPICVGRCRYFQLWPSEIVGDE